MRRRGGAGSWGRRAGRLLQRLALLLLVLAGVTLVSAAVVRARCAVPEETATTPPPGAPGVAAADRESLFPPDARRPEVSTYLTFPEWYIVYSAEEYGAWLGEHPPSGFPYFRSVGQYWCGYNTVFELTRRRFPFNGDNHLMLVVIGTSYTAEYAVKGLYENTIGRLTEALSDGGRTAEDDFALEVARDYGAFLNKIPWYEYPFGARLAQLWGSTGLWGPHPVRKWERKLALSLEYGGKALYGRLIGIATGTVFDPDAQEVLVWAADVPPAAPDPRIEPGRQVDARSQLLVMPRFSEFTETALPLLRQGTRLLAVAGNDELMLTAIAPAAWRYSPGEGRQVLELPVPTDPARKRVAIAAPIASLHTVVAALERDGVRIEHLYDY